MDAFVLSRIQFAANISFHILFPTISIALGWVLLYFKWRHNQACRIQGVAPATGVETPWMKTYQFWVKIFALTFALGVVSGLTMSFQFGTNWPGFMKTVGNVAGPLLAYEVLSAFFLEATFLGIMLFGSRQVSNRVHTLATFLVAFGTTLSAFWILALNSWMHTPAGFEIRDGQAFVTSWWAVIFNPSFPYRLTHMLVASGLTVSFLMAGLSAYRWLRKDRCPSTRIGLRTGVKLAALLIPLQIVLGDLHGLNTLEHQPAKLAAMEGLWETGKGIPMVLFGLPNESGSSTRYEIAIPKLASVYLTHTLDGEVRGLNEFPNAHPPVAPVFWAFRIMIGVGMLMLAVSWLSAWSLRRHEMPPERLCKALVGMTFAGWVAVLAGWYTTEIGRQPFLVQGVLRTVDAVTAVKPAFIGVSLALYLTLYAVLIVAYIWVLFYMARQAGTGTIADPETPLDAPAPARLAK